MARHSPPTVRPPTLLFALGIGLGLGCGPTASEETSKAPQRTKATKPTKVPKSFRMVHLMGQPTDRVTYFLKRTFSVTPVSATTTEKTDWGTLGEITARTQLLRCPPQATCGYSNILLFSDDKTDRVIGGLTSMGDHHPDPKRTAIDFFRLIAGSQHAQVAASWLDQAFGSKPVIGGVFGEAKFKVERDPQRRMWTIVVTRR